MISASIAAPRKAFDEDEHVSVAEALIYVAKATGGVVTTEGINRSGLIRDIGDAFRRGMTVVQVRSPTVKQKAGSKLAVSRMVPSARLGGAST